ncbi:FkbM family methyltransferase [Alkalicaulis satelles]|uniref:FkbM family methyltransferase n=1 Tax=Alkalicaulis satelles TaxID=2609175 RepID=A0A5M6ZJW8_9PROT|nr:FkbM family methyltransferase [Alkalicaulis satelles]KAA5803528.1 FkbM family methyltransferase [Alkalicaulis satelles]
MHVSAHIRALQSRFPALLEAKAGAQRLMRRALRQPFEADFTLLSRWTPEPGEVFIDVGANRGQSIDAIRLYHPDALIHAFEPNAHLAAQLARVFARDGALAVYACGLGERDETRTLHVPVYRGFVYDGLASFDAAECAGWLNADTVAGFDPDKLEIIAFEARAFPLDDLDLNPGFIKLDVQGFERSVLTGARATLERCQPLVMLENNADADAFLTGELGWTRAAWTGTALSPGREGALNTLYYGPQRAASLMRAELLG